jgi:hypothetical protein
MEGQKRNDALPATGRRGKELSEPLRRQEEEQRAVRERQASESHTLKTRLEEILDEARRKSVEDLRELINMKRNQQDELRQVLAADEEAPQEVEAAWKKFCEQHGEDQRKLRRQHVEAWKQQQRETETITGKFEWTSRKEEARDVILDLLWTTRHTPKLRTSYSRIGTLLFSLKLCAATHSSRM